MQDQSSRYQPLDLAPDQHPPRQGPWPVDPRPLGTPDEIHVHSVTDASESEAEPNDPALEARRRRWRLRDLAGALLPGERVEHCGYRAVPGKSITITRNGEGRHGVAHVRSCGSVWVCPTCAAKIAATRAEEIEHAIRAWQDRGGTVLMLTLTVNHGRADQLDALLDGLTKSMSALWGGRWAKDWRKRWGHAGGIRNLEATWGMSNGWHPHSHVLIFLGHHPGEIEEYRNLTPQEVSRAQSELAHRWRKVASRRGFDVTLEHGAKLEKVPTPEEAATDANAGRDAETAARYATKIAQLEEVRAEETGTGRTWGAAQEITWHHIKRASRKRFTPWALLEASENHTELDDPTNRAPALWQEYADAYKGRRHLVWSRGLRELLELEAEQTDEELAEAHDETAQEVGTVDSRTWRTMRKQGTVTELLEMLDRDAKTPEDSRVLCAGWLEWYANAHGFEQLERRRRIEA